MRLRWRWRWRWRLKRYYGIVLAASGRIGALTANDPRRSDRPFSIGRMGLEHASEAKRGWRPSDATAKVRALLVNCPLGGPGCLRPTLELPDLGLSRFAEDRSRILAKRPGDPSHREHVRIELPGSVFALVTLVGTQRNPKAFGHVLLPQAPRETRQFYPTPNYSEVDLIRHYPIIEASFQNRNDTMASS